MPLDDEKSKEQLLAELADARRQIAELAGSKAGSDTARRQFWDSEERFRTLFEQPLVGVVIGAPDGAIRDCNEAFAQMLGYTREELCGAFAQELTHPEDWERENRMHDAVRAGTNDVTRLEKRYLAKDGSEVWVDLTSNVSRNETGEPLFLVGMVIDISERKRTEERLQESETRYRSLFLRSSEGVFLHDRNGAILDANQAALEMFGYTLEEITSLHPSQLVHPDEAPLVRDEFMGILRDEFVPAEHRCLRKDGTEIRVITRGKLVAENLIQGVLQDVTQQRLQEEQLKLLTRAVEQVEQSIVVTNDQGEIQYVNPHFTTLTGYTPDEVTGENPRLLKSGHLPDSFYSELWQTITSGKTWKGEFCNRHKSGELFWDSSTISPIFDASGQITHFMAVKQNVTERRRTEEALRQSEERYRSIVENLPRGAVFLFDQDHRYIYAGGEALAEQGLTPQDLVGRTIEEVFPQELSSIALASTRKIFDGHKADYQATLKGRVYSCHGGPVLDQKGQISQGLIIAQDVTEHAQAQEALEEALLWQEELVSAGRVGLWDWDAKTNSVSYSEEWKRQVGCEGNEIGNSFEEWRTRLHPEDMERTTNYIQKQVFGDSSGFQVEFRFRHKDGSYRWIYAQASIFRDDWGQPYRVLGSHVDITDRKQAEEALRENEETLRGIFDTMHSGAILVDQQGRITFANQFTTELFDLSAEQILGSNYLDLLVESRDAANDNMQRLIQGEVDSVFVERRYKRGQNQSFWGQISGSRLLHPDGSFWALVGVITDLSERKQAEEALVHAKQEFELIFNNSQVGIMFLQGGRVFARGNQRLADILGYESPLDMVGLSMRALHIDDEHFRHFGQTYYCRLNQEEQIQVEYQLRRKDGKAIWCSLSGKALDTSDLKKGVIWVIDDLEPRKALESALVKAKVDAEAASQAKSEFLANMSHEIRTPMNGILGMLQLLESTPLEEDQREYVGMAAQSSKRLTRLLTDILDLSRVEAGKLSMHCDPFDLPVVLRQVADLFRPNIQQAELDFELEIDDSLPRHVMGDAARLQQILTNFIGNAIKFTAMGSISLHAYRLSSLTPGQARILFLVQDTGPGIPDDKLKNLFQPFTQVVSGHRRQYQGAGLGLAICKHLLDLMGGSITLCSEVGQGTSVFFCVPFSLPAPADVGLPDAAGEELTPVMSPVTVLLVEDDVVSRVMACKLLEKFGCTVIAVENGEQALATLQQGEFTVVFMDVQMPVMDGVTTTKAIREGQAGEANREIPVVAMTAYAMLGDKQRFLEAGMNDYIPKPIDLEACRRVISRLATGDAPS